MLLFERLIALYAPFSCLGCGVEDDKLLCEGCVSSLPRVPSRCYRCRASSRDYSVCARCRPYTPLRHVYVCTPYDGLARELLHAAKYERARAGLDEITALLAPLLAGYDADDAPVLAPIPTATRRVRARGYDQAVAIARGLSRLVSIPFRSLLARLGQAHQVGAGRAERGKHLAGAFRVRSRGGLPEHVLLVDDVLTTGATVETAARALKKAGVRSVDAIVFAQPD